MPLLSKKLLRHTEFHKAYLSHSMSMRAHKSTYTCIDHSCSTQQISFSRRQNRILGAPLTIPDLVILADFLHIFLGLLLGLLLLGLLVPLIVMTFEDWNVLRPICPRIHLSRQCPA